MGALQSADGSINGDSDGEQLTSKRASVSGDRDGIRIDAAEKGAATTAGAASTTATALQHGPPPNWHQTNPGIAPAERLALATIVSPELAWGKTDLLFRASHDGFSMAGFEGKVLRYPGPSVLLVRTADTTATTASALVNGSNDLGEGDNEEKQSNVAANMVGLFVDSPWKHSSKDTFGGIASCFFLTTSSAGLGAHTPGSSHDKDGVGRAAQLQRYPGKAFFSKSHGLGSGRRPDMPADGDDTLSLDTSLDVLTLRTRLGGTTTRAVVDVEVWGLGGDVEAQRKAWEWEEREAERRRQVNVRDLDAEYDFLQLAGLVGQNRSGGSV